jgi:aspartate/glutamate racemase
LANRYVQILKEEFMFSKKIAIIHTSFVFILREKMITELLTELIPNAELINIVDDSLLAQVVAVGYIPSHVYQRMCSYFVCAETAGADIIFNACSSLGPAADIAKKLVKIPVVKIDEAMAEAVVKQFDHIGILATVPTTIGPTKALISEKATELGKSVSLQSSCLEEAFQALMKGNASSHDEMVIRGAKEMAKSVDSIVLAQASMARLGPILQAETQLPVFSSPRMGVEHVKRVYDSLMD